MRLTPNPWNATDEFLILRVASSWLGLGLGVGDSGLGVGDAMGSALM
jgi:hypothetical protein